MTYDYRNIDTPMDRLTRGGSAGRVYRVNVVTLIRLEDRGNSGGREHRVISSGTAVVVTHSEYTNRVWHYTNAAFVRWVTQDDPDPTGVSYPGPGTFGVDTTSPAVVESWEPA